MLLCNWPSMTTFDKLFLITSCIGMAFFKHDGEALAFVSFYLRIVHFICPVHYTSKQSRHFYLCKEHGILLKMRYSRLILWASCVLHLFGIPSKISMHCILFVTNQIYNLWIPNQLQIKQFDVIILSVTCVASVNWLNILE